MYVHWYYCIVLNPNSFYKISRKTLKKQQISRNSKLRYIYLNKKADPQLKCIAIEAIMFFF